MKNRPNSNLFVSAYDDMRLRVDSAFFLSARTPNNTDNIRKKTALTVPKRRGEFEKDTHFGSWAASAMRCQLFELPKKNKNRPMILEQEYGNPTSIPPGQPETSINDQPQNRLLFRLHRGLADPITAGGTWFAPPSFTLRD